MHVSRDAHGLAKSVVYKMQTKSKAYKMQRGAGQ